MMGQNEIHLFPLFIKTNYCRVTEQWCLLKRTKCNRQRTITRTCILNVGFGFVLSQLLYTIIFNHLTVSIPAGMSLVKHSCTLQSFLFFSLCFVLNFRTISHYSVKTISRFGLLKILSTTKYYLFQVVKFTFVWCCVLLSFTTSLEVFIGSLLNNPKF